MPASHTVWCDLPQYGLIHRLSVHQNEADHACGSVRGLCQCAKKQIHIVLWQHRRALTCLCTSLFLALCIHLAACPHVHIAMGLRVHVAISMCIQIATCTCILIAACAFKHVVTCTKVHIATCMHIHIATCVHIDIFFLPR